MSEVVAQVSAGVNLIVGIFALFAIIEIFHISKSLKKILDQIKAADKHRREEFDAMTQGGQDA